MVSGQFTITERTETNSFDNKQVNYESYNKVDLPCPFND